MISTKLARSRRTVTRLGAYPLERLSHLFAMLV